MKIDRVFINFLLVGVLNTIFGYSMFALFIYLHMHYTAAVALSTILGVLFNFKTIGTLVFKSRDNRLIFRFISVYILLYVLNIGGIRLFDIIGVENKYISGGALVLPLALLSFVLNKRFVFSR